tara:strand:+ start:231 stop:653 length:423 start_codon:yes stop_codon:yes gene_type:complete
MNIPIKIISEDSVIPKQANQSDAGYDLFSVEDVTLEPLERSVVKTGIQLSLPKGYYGRVAPRSGLAVKMGIDVLAGVIDSGYVGEIGVVLINLSSDHQTLKKGDKIAQLIIEKCYPALFYEVDDLEETQRGQLGFGSSGH